MPRGSGMNSTAPLLRSAPQVAADVLRRQRVRSTAAHLEATAVPSAPRALPGFQGADIVQDLERWSETEIEQDGKRYMPNAARPCRHQNPRRRPVVSIRCAAPPRKLHQISVAEYIHTGPKPS
jgi:hypothetical protein